MAFNKDNYNNIFGAYKANAIEILQEEYKAGRVTGADYSNALVQILGNIVLEASKAEQAQEKLEADTKLALSKLVKENELADAKIKLTLKQIDEIDNNLKIKYMLSEKDIEKKTHEISKIDADIKVELAGLKLKQEEVAATINKINADTKLEIEKLELAKQEFDYKSKMYPKELELKDKELKLTDRKITLAEKEIDLDAAKIQDIKDQKYLNMFSKQLDAWSLMFTTGLLEDKPSIISDDRVTELYNYLADYS